MSLRNWRRSRRWRPVALALLIPVLLLVAIRHWPRAPLSADLGYSQAVYDRHGRLLRLSLASDQRYRLWVPLADMPPALVEAVKLHEDAWFDWHPGVNPVSLMRAAWSTYAGGTRVGGSTLSMQLVRLRHGLHTRSLGGKLEQMLGALWLEMRYGKAEILEAYLNRAPYGGNVEGVGAAALIYFDKPPARLTLAEALTLAVLPQAPARRGRFAEDAEGRAIGPSLRAARDRLYLRWRERHGATPAADAEMAASLRLRSPRELPFLAPHFVERVLAEQWRRGEGGSIIHSSLDLGLQRVLERRVAEHLARWRLRGIENAMAMLVDTRDLGIRALIGSADYFDARIAGQVDGTAGKRSPGSTLKPFIYALALDQGLLHPATVLRDVPSHYGSYSPENFDGRFLGPVTATDALARSRNIPAVTVAARLRQPSFYDFLRQAGIRDMASAEHYGLALVLGGGEVTLEELATLYAMLSRDGQLSPLSVLRQDQAARGGKAMLSAEASFIVRDMLSQHPRPDFATHADTDARRVAWKTGTSWGFRDAWTAGIVGPYVLVVWLGHFDGRANAGLVGVEVAAPLFFAIIDALQAEGVPLPEPPRRWPLNLARVEVCRASGDLPNVWCPQRGQTWFIPGVSPIRVSTVHRAIQIDRRSGAAVCGAADPATVMHKVYEFWPSDLAAVFEQAGLPRRKPPPAAECAGAAQWLGSAPLITSPTRVLSYRLKRQDPERGSLRLAATTDADVRRLYWFEGSSFLGSSAASKPLDWHPLRSGPHHLRVVDDHGRSNEREVVIEWDEG